MRLRAGLFLCLFAILLGVGCRKALAPFENNQAPETWITAAPQDTITLKDADGKPIFNAPGMIPVRFHLYWAGSDQDGAVIGYYFAVVETLAVSPFGLPPLPGPKPRDYHYTTRTDSTFIFNVAEQVTDRLHAFFIYAVDDKGKPDATPARFIFNAQDRYPPAISIITARAEGDVWRLLPGGTLLKERKIFAIKDTANILTAVKDTVPAASALNFAWHGEPTLPGTYVTGYKYKLDEATFNAVDSSVHVATYNSGIADHVSPGAKQFTVLALDQAGGARKSNRRFQMNMSPITWYSGPDPTAYPYTRRGSDHSRIETFVDVNWAASPTLPGSLMSSDSLTKLPALRSERRTFFEIYQNRIYVRSENDTVNMNSWVVLSSGGLDPDSPYRVKASHVSGAGPDSNGTPAGTAVVVHEADSNGSPIGFHSQIINVQTPFGTANPFSLNALYPNFDPASVGYRPYINSYWPMYLAGKLYAIVRAEDGDGRGVGGEDFEIGNVVDLADRVDAGGGSAYEIALRRRIITFFVDKAPYLRPFSTAGFKPVPNYAYPSRVLDVNLPAGDDDPYDVENKPARVGGPSLTTVLQWFVKFRGKNSDGRDTTFAPDFLNPMPLQQASAIVLPSYIVSTNVFVDIRLCDCKNCQANLIGAVDGAGRCVDYTIPVTVPPPPAPAGATSMSQSDHPGPGSSQAVRRDAP